MIDKELIKGQKVLEGLTDEQVAAIEQLAKNAEKEIADRVTGKVHGYYDENFKAILGVEKPSGTFSSEFWKEQVATLKEKAAKAGDNSEVEGLRKTIASLEEQIKSGKGGEALVAKLEKEKAELAATVEDLRNQYSAGKQEWETKLTEKEKAFRQVEVDRLLSEELAVLKFKASIPENLRKIALNTAKQAILSQYETDIQEGTGGRRLIFKKDGAVLSNRENGLNPYTGLELIRQHEAVKEIIDTGHQQAGAGTTGKPAGQLVGDVVQVGQVRSKVEADDAIKAALHAQGLASTDPRYHEIKRNTWEQVVKPMNLPLK